MEAGRSCGWCRKSSSGSAGGACCGELGIRPDVCHLNEGHAAFAVLERARGFMQDTGQPFDVALAVTRAGNLFTTHTAVDAGFDRFAPALIEQYLGGYAQAQLGITLDQLLALGRKDPADSSEPFNMAYLAMRGCGRVNGVSRLHGQVSRHLFAPLFPGWPDDEVPVGPRDQRRPRADLGIRRSRRTLDGGVRERPLAGHGRMPGEGHPSPSRRPGCGSCAWRPPRLSSTSRATGWPDNCTACGAAREAVEQAKRRCSIPTP